MKIILLLIVITLASLYTNAQFTKADLQATGLTCAMCSNAIYKALTAVPFVETVKPDIKNSAFHIEFKKEPAIEIDVIKKAVEDAGFSVGSLNVTGNFENLKVANDQHVNIGHDVFHFLNVSEQSLNGEKTIAVVDKDYLTARQFKKFSAASHMDCVKTGRAAECCNKAGVSPGTRIYHVTIK